MNDENQELNPQPVEQPAEQPNSQPTEQAIELEAKLQAYYQISYGETRPADELWRKLAVQLETAPASTQSVATFSADSEVISIKAIYPQQLAKKSWRLLALVTSLAIAVIALIAVLIISANSVQVDSAVISQAITPTASPNLNSVSGGTALSNVDLSYPGATEFADPLSVNYQLNISLPQYYTQNFNYNYTLYKIYASSDDTKKIATFYAQWLQNAHYTVSFTQADSEPTCSSSNNCPNSSSTFRTIVGIAGSTFFNINVEPYVQTFTNNSSPQARPTQNIIVIFRGTLSPLNIPTPAPVVTKDYNIELVITGSERTYYPDSPNEFIPLSIYNESSQVVYVQTCETIILQREDSNGNWIDVAPDVPCLPPPHGPEMYSIPPNLSTSSDFGFHGTKAYTGQNFREGGIYRLKVIYYTNCNLQSDNSPSSCTGKHTLASTTFQIKSGLKPMSTIPYIPITTSAPITQTMPLDVNSLTYPNAVPLVVSNTNNLPSGFTDTYAPIVQKAFAITDTLANVNNYFNREFAQAGYTVINSEDSCSICGDTDAKTQLTIARQGSQFIAVTVYNSVYWQSMAYQKDFYPLATQLIYRENLITIIAGTSLTPTATPTLLPTPAALGIDALTYPFTFTTNVTETMGLKNFATINFGVVISQRTFASNDDFRKVANFYNQKLLDAGYNTEVTPLSFYMGCPAYGNATPPTNVCVPIVIGYTLKATRGTNFIYVDVEGDYYYLNNSLGRELSGIEPNQPSLTFAKVAVGTGASVSATPTP